MCQEIAGFSAGKMGEIEDKKMKAADVSGINGFS